MRKSEDSLIEAIVIVALIVACFLAFGYYKKVEREHMVTEIGNEGYQGVNLVARQIPCKDEMIGELFTATNEKSERVYAVFCAGEGKVPYIEVIRNSGSMK